jgi:Neprosin/Neprosin activation peptide
MSDPKGIKPLKEYLDSIDKTKPGEFVAAAADRTKIADEGSLGDMRAHILNHYKGVEAVHSFKDANGSIFDCIPMEQQPGLRAAGGTVPKPVDLPKMTGATAAATPAAEERKTQLLASPLGAGKKDDQGNEMNCPDGTIPMRRLTLEQMSKFKSLRSFFSKNPLEKEVKPPQAAAAPAGVPATHRWAHAFQNINVLGGHSFINVWDPPIGANQVFSLSQHWYVGGSGAGLQTAEVGWQVYPGMYGGTSPVFFVYWTADDYNKTGCYNLTCNHFVQTNKSWPIGGAIGPSSVYGGGQYEVQVAFYLTGGNWWLYVNGGAASNTVGYYPASQYGSGAMSKGASEIDYGGEVVGTTSFPQMGSGHFANQGWQKAAYHRQVQAYPTAGGAVDASLTPSQAWPNCYTAVVTKYAPTWSETLWYGGPGGNC